MGGDDDALDAIQPIVAAALSDAVSFIDSDIGPLRAKALDFYHGRPLDGDEEIIGRSTVVSRDVHDMVSAAMPSLMRIFFGPEHVVEFEPYGPEDVEEAEQKTDYINYIVTTDNPGFEVFYAALKDALRSKVGIVKYWWDDTETTTTRHYSGLDENTLTALLDDTKGATKAELVEAKEDDDGLSCVIRVTRRADRARIDAIPPEEFLISRNARSIDDAILTGHRSLKTASELRAMGYSEEQIGAGGNDALEWSEERLARNPYLTDGEAGIDPSTRQILYIEAYLRTDMDGDGIAELRRICCIGSSYRVVHNEQVDDHPFADFHCDPEPHTYFGESLADKVMDVQVTKTRLLRGGLDGQAQSLFPRTIVGANGNVEDAMNTEVGAILRSKGDPDSGYSFQSVPDTSKQVMPFLTYMDDLRENRTGISKVSMGLDAEALQNTTATAAEGNFTRSQERIELIARIMASGMRKLFRGLARLAGENQRAERVIKLRGKWTPIDPRSWAGDMNVICNVGLGGGSQAQKVAVLSMIAQKQEQVMMTAGPENPLVTIKNLYTTYSKLVQEAGFKNPDAFFTDPDSDEVKERMAAKGPPPPDPKVVEAEQKIQLEREKAQASVEMAQEKAVADLTLARERHQLELEQRREEQALEMAHKRELAAAELALKREEMQMEFALKSEANRMNAEAKSSSIDGPSQGGEPG